MIKRLDPRKDNGRVIKFNLILLPWTQDVVYAAFMPYEQILKLRFDSALRDEHYTSSTVFFDTLSPQFRRTNLPFSQKGTFIEVDGR